MMVAKPQTVGYIIGFQSAIIVGMLVISVLVSRAMHLSYEDHQAVAFISVSKNQSVAAAIATMALNPVSAIAPSIIPMIQPILSIIYINLEKPVRKLLAQKNAMPAAPTILERQGIAPASVSKFHTDGAGGASGTLSQDVPEPPSPTPT